MSFVMSATADVTFSDANFMPCGSSGHFSSVGFESPWEVDASQSSSGFQVTGTVAVIDDCYFALSDFSFTGTSTSLSLWTSMADEDPYSFGGPIHSTLAPLSPASSPLTLAVFIQSAGLTWDNIQVILLVSTDASGNLDTIFARVTLPKPGHVAASDSLSVVSLQKTIFDAADAANLVASPPPPSPPLPPAEIAPPPTSSPSEGMQNCVTLGKDRMNLYWTVRPDRDSFIIEYGLEAKVGDGSWLGFGISANQSSPQMKNSDVVIVGFPSEGAGVAGAAVGDGGGDGASGNGEGFAVDFFVTAMEPCEEVAGGFVGVCPDSVFGNSQELNNVQLTLAARSGDVTFVRYKKAISSDDHQFDIDLATLSPKLDAPLWSIFATGPLSPNFSPSNPSPLQHEPSQGYFAGSKQITFSPAKKGLGCKPLWGSKPTPHPTLPPFVAPTPPGQMAPPGPPRIGDTIFGLDSCSTTFQNSKRQFLACKALPGGYFFMWTLKGDLLSAAFVSQSIADHGYAAVGFSSSSDMNGSSLLVASSSFSGGSTAILVKQFEIKTKAVSGALAGHSVAKHAVIGGSLSVVTAAAQLQAGSLTILFSLTVSGQQNLSHLLWTRGAAANGTQLSADGLSALASGQIDLDEGSASSGKKSTPSAWVAHGILSTLSWGVLLPLGAITGRYVRHFSPFWFPIHRGVQIVGFYLAMTAVAVGLTMEKSSDASAHSVIGLTLAFIVFIQVLAALWRPDEGHWLRPHWTLAHRWVGVALLMTSAVQIFLGLSAANAGVGLFVAYGLWLATLLTAVVGLEGFIRRREVKMGGAEKDDMKGKAAGKLGLATVEDGVEDAEGRRARGDSDDEEDDDNDDDDGGGESVNLSGDMSEDDEAIPALLLPVKGIRREEKQPAMIKSDVDFAMSRPAGQQASVERAGQQLAIQQQLEEVRRKAEAERRASLRINSSETTQAQQLPSSSGSTSGISVAAAAAASASVVAAGMHDANADETPRATASPKPPKPPGASVSTGGRWLSPKKGPMGGEGSGSTSAGGELKDSSQSVSKRKLSGLTASSSFRGGRSPEPAIKMDKYNVKATVVRAPDLQSLKKSLLAMKDTPLNIPVKFISMGGNSSPSPSHTPNRGPSPALSPRSAGPSFHQQVSSSAPPIFAPNPLAMNPTLGGGSPLAPVPEATSESSDTSSLGTPILPKRTMDSSKASGTPSGLRAIRTTPESTRLGTPPRTMSPRTVDQF